MKHVDIFTDGACSGNPGPGGWGAVLRYGDVEKELSGGEAETTNNRMELLAAISALNALRQPCEVDLHTDSKYVMDGISKWIHGWKRNGWKTGDRKPVKNGELWQALDEARNRHNVTWHWVKGHAGHPENERADAGKSPARRESADARFWVLATRAEALVGLGDPAAQRDLDSLLSAAPAAWMADVTRDQISKLRSLLSDSPLKHLAPPSA